MKVKYIEKIIINFRNQGFKNFIISVKYLGDKIKRYLGNGNKLKVPYVIKLKTTKA